MPNSPPDTAVHVFSSLGCAVLHCRGQPVARVVEARTREADEYQIFARLVNRSVDNQVGRTFLESCSTEWLTPQHRGAGAGAIRPLHQASHPRGHRTAPLREHVNGALPPASWRSSPRRATSDRPTVSEQPTSTSRPPVTTRSATVALSASAGSHTRIQVPFLE